MAFKHIPVPLQPLNLCR